MQDEITEAVTIAIAPAIAHAERQRAMRKPPESLDAWAAYQRGLWHLSHVTAGEKALAEKFFRQSIELDPTFAGGHAGLAYALANAGNTFQQMDFNDAMGAAEASARRAVALDATDAEAHAVLSGTLAGRGDMAVALIEAEHARSLSPNLASAHGALSMLLIYSGRAREGIAAHQTCARLDPRDPRLGWRLHRVALGHYFIGEYAPARDAAELAINAVAEKFFQRAIDLDPLFAGGYTGLALALNQAWGLFHTRSYTEGQSAEEAAAHRAVALDGGDAEARSRLSFALIWRGDHQGARAEAERALAICPNLASAHGALGVALAYSAGPREGLAVLETCIRLDPRQPNLSGRLSQVAMALYFCREYAAAVEAAKRAIRSFPDRSVNYRWLAAALGQLGRSEEAKKALERAIAVAPDSFDMSVRHRAPWFRPDDHAHMLEGLRKAGWQG